MTINRANINSLWASLLIEELTRHGVDYACISPGSRSTPLTVAAAAHDAVNNLVHFDERGAAFHALGYARATGKPAVLICTSGTALANYLPAVVEAHMAMLPMILLTADRPPELQNCGANQTITQPGIYSHFVRDEILLPCPDISSDPRAMLTLIDQAAAKATANPPGPVHVNCPFREPLAPVDSDQDFSAHLAALKDWLGGRQPLEHIKYPDTPTTASQAASEAIEVLTSAENGLLVVGRIRQYGDREAVLGLARHLGWPLLPDITSGLRLGITESMVVPYYDQIIAASGDDKSLAPDVCLHLGGAFTSKRMLRFLDINRPGRYIHVESHDRCIDPNHQVTMRPQLGIDSFCGTVAERLADRPASARLARFRQLSRIVDEAIDSVLSAEAPLTEPGIARAISRMIPPDHGLFLASSLPIREMDWFAASDGHPVRVASNRGASGIDGTVASAAGYAVGLNRPVTLLIGDLALLHDLNSLAMLPALPVPVTVIVVNNDGGNIFSLLPIAEHTDVFERFFRMPHGLYFDRAAEMFGLSYSLVDSMTSFTEAYTTAEEGDGSRLIEAVVEPAGTRRTHNDIVAAIRSRLA